MKSKVYRNKADLIESSIDSEDLVLDIGFWGQGKTVDDKDWPHRIILERAKKVHGLDLEFDEGRVDLRGTYHKGSAEDFSIGERFSVIFAGDLIEHLSNPGNFLSCSKEHIEDGILILTTPNAFNLFNIASKMVRREPPVNSDHTFYFNFTTLSALLRKNGWDIVEMSYVYSLEYSHKESLKKRFLNVIYLIISLFTNKFLESVVVMAKPRPKSS